MHWDSDLTVGLAQVEPVLADIAANLATHLDFATQAQAAGVELLVFPELSLTGAALHQHLPAVARTADAEELRAIGAAAAPGAVVIGFAELHRDGHTYNSLAFYADGELVHVHRKCYLVTAVDMYERLMFAEGHKVRAFPTRWGPMALLNCEDSWHLPMPYLAAMDGARTLISCASTPYHFEGQLSNDDLWLTINRAYSITTETYNIFVNRVGVEGSNRFFGGSHIIDPRGAVIAQAPLDEPGLTVCTLDMNMVDRQRRQISYIRDERLSLTLRELQRIADHDQHD